MRNSNVSGLFISQRKTISPQTKLDGITQRRAAEHFHLRVVAEAHLQESPAQFRIAAHTDDVSAAADAKLVQAAGFRIRAGAAGFKPT
jgi:hypothetical protein